MKTNVFLFCVLAFAVLPCLAAEYHVDQNNPAASDANPGTAAAPFKTIAAAIKQIAPGDTVTIHAGVYRETIGLRDHKTSPTRITVIQAAPGEQVVLEGADPITGWQSVGGKVWSAPWPYKWGDAPIPAQWPESVWRFPMCRREGVFVEGGPLAQVRTREEMMPGTFVIDEENAKIFVWLLDSESPNGRDVESSIRGPLVQLNGCEYVRIDGLTVQHGLARGAGVSLTDSHNSTVANCRIEWNLGSGISVRSNANLALNYAILNNVITFNGESGIGGYRIKGARFEGNETSYNNWRPGQVGTFGWAYGGMKVMRHLDCRITDHVAVNNLTRGIWFDFNHKNNIIDRTLFHGNMDRTVYLEAGIGTNWVTNCLISGTRGIGQGICIANAPDQRIYHNTLVNNGVVGIWVGGSAGPRGTVPDNSFSTDADIRCNLFYNAGKNSAIELGRLNYGNMLDYVMRTFRADGNRYYSDVQTDVFRAGADRLTFAQWQERGWDKLGAWSAPKLVDPAHGDFRPLDEATANTMPYVCPDEPTADMLQGERKAHLAGAFMPTDGKTPLPAIADIQRYAPLDEMPLVVGDLGQLFRLAQVSQVRHAAPYVTFTAVNKVWGDDVWVKTGQDGAQRLALVVNPAPWQAAATITVPNGAVKDRVNGKSWNAPAGSVKLTLAPYQVLVLEIAATGAVSATAEVSAAIHGQLSRQVEALQEKAAGNEDLMKLVDTAQADLKSGRHVAVWETMQSSVVRKAGVEINRLMDEGRL